MSGRFYEFSYEVRKGDTFASVLTQFVNLETSIINSKSPTTIRTRDKNPQISDWRNLETQEKVHLVISEKVADLAKIKRYVGLNKTQMKLKRYYDFSLSTFYMATRGSFSETSKNYNIDGSENSFLMLGLLAEAQIAEKHRLSSSFSTKFVSTFNTGVKNDISIPNEIYVNLYDQYQARKINTTFFGGFDFEKFSTIDYDTLLISSKSTSNNHTLGLLTVGFSKFFILKKWKVEYKFSYSHSLFSSLSSLFATVPFKGSKYSLDLDSWISKNFFMKGFARFYTLDGHSNYSSLRIGFGIGYKFF